ncbi:hybrid sensor histidine kinase/response regulator [Desulfospira joergensenii]|uniref:hybrid sensor histidine kinase/response regulator n=1 Tax=Desulfospira joergensenii TaxID=53329 RepID=UPI0003B722BC|nr:PAS domain-containing sensor histidine kinase [Desulfospira joergensenii]
MSAQFSHEELERQIKELEKTEKALIQSESHLRTLVDSIPDLIWLKDPNGVYLRCNPTFERLFGAEESSIVGKTDYDFVDKELADFFRKNDCKAMELDRPCLNEEWLTFSDDGYHGLFETVKTPMKSPDGKLIGVLGIARDITKRKLTEESLKETERKLREAQKMAKLGFWSWDIHSGAVEWSDEVYQIFRLDPDEFIPRIESIQALSPWSEDHQRDAELIRRARENKEPGAYEQKFLFPDKSIGFYYSTFQGIYDDQGDLRAIKGTVQDITEKKRAEEEQKRMEEQLIQAQKMESIGRLAGGVAHDFNNMLSIILGNAEMVLDGLDKANPLMSNVKEILKAAERSTNLTKQLLAFARKQTIDPQLLDLNEIIDDMLKMLNRLIGEDIDLVWLPQKPLGLAKIDPSQVDQVLANLCINARDSIRGVGKVTIETGNVVFDTDYCREHRGCVPGHFVMIGVSDNGSGMDKATQANLFEPFFTTKEKGQGSGLGLATVYGIVKQNNGFINVYSEPDQGTSFKIYLPSHAESMTPEVKTDLRQEYSGGNETLLLVEDESAILQMTQTILTGLGYKVLAASTPNEAIEIVRKNDEKKIDLLITDVILPEMNGRDLSKKLLRMHPDLKCLFMSGYTANVIAHHGVLDKGIAFINKPFSRQDLGRKIREVLDES